MRSMHTKGIIAANENDVFIGDRPSWLGNQKRAVIFCHGADDTAIDPVRDQYYLLYGLAKSATVYVGDLGLNTWANPTGRARVEAARQELITKWGHKGKVDLVGMSMGHAVAVAYANQYSQNVRSIAGVIPLIDINNAMNYSAASINAAYGGAWNQATHGPTSNPLQINLPTSIPHKIWCADNDTFVPYSIAQAYVAARPHTELVNLGSWGHSDAAVTIATADMIKWIASK